MTFLGRGGHQPAAAWSARRRLHLNRRDAAEVVGISAPRVQQLSGVTVPLSDLLIFACAKVHGLGIGHDDGHFDELAKLEA